MARNGLKSCNPVIMSCFMKGQRYCFHLNLITTMYRPDKKVYKSFSVGLIFPSFIHLKLAQPA